MDSKYILGISELDSQHEEIETAFFACQKTIDTAPQPQALAESLEKLYETLRFHFHAEESIMQIFAYPETQEHKRSHLAILQSVESYKNNKLSDADIRLLREEPLQRFLEQILAQDMRFAAFINRSKDRLGIL